MPALLVLQEPWYPCKTSTKVKSKGADTGVKSKAADRTKLCLCLKEHKDATKAISTVKMFEVHLQSSVPHAWQHEFIFCKDRKTCFGPWVYEPVRQVKG